MTSFMRKKFEVNEIEGRLQAAFAGLLASPTKLEPGQFYAEACEQLAAIQSGSKDVMAFSRKLKSHRHMEGIAAKAGLFISAMVATSAEQQFVISPNGLDKPLEYIGYENSKELVIIGDAGAHLGFRMTGGSIFVDGDAGTETGAHMTDGTIWVQGDAAERAGLFMRGGRIHIRGRAGKDLGHGRVGGTILVGAHAKSAPVPASAVMGTGAEAIVAAPMSTDSPKPVLGCEPAKLTVS